MNVLVTVALQINYSHEPSIIRTSGTVFSQFVEFLLDLCGGVGGTGDDTGAGTGVVL